MLAIAESYTGDAAEGEKIADGVLAVICDELENNAALHQAAHDAVWDRLSEVLLPQNECKGLRFESEGSAAAKNISFIIRGSTLCHAHQISTTLQ